MNILPSDTVLRKNSSAVNYQAVVDYHLGGIAEYLLAKSKAGDNSYRILLEPSDIFAKEVGREFSRIFTEPSFLNKIYLDNCYVVSNISGDIRDMLIGTISSTYLSPSVVSVTDIYTTYTPAYSFSFEIPGYSIAKLIRIDV